MLGCLHDDLTCSMKYLEVAASSAQSHPPPSNVEDCHPDSILAGFLFVG